MGASHDISGQRRVSTVIESTRRLGQDRRDLWNWNAGLDDLEVLSIVHHAQELLCLATVGVVATEHVHGLFPRELSWDAPVSVDTILDTRIEREEVFETVFGSEEIAGPFVISVTIV